MAALATRISLLDLRYRQWYHLTRGKRGQDPERNAKQSPQLED
jgi:hypothetical protein